MKRLLSLCLAVVMIFGMLPAFSLQTYAEETISSAYQAAYAQTVNVDGSLSEPQWLTDGKIKNNSITKNFGVLWNADNIYLAVVPGTDDGELTATVNSTEFSISAGAVTSNGVAVDGAEAQRSAEAIEVQIPMSAFDLTLYDYSQTVPMELAMGGTSWEGTLCFSSLERTDFTPAMVFGKQVEFAASTSEALGAEAVTDGYHFFHKYLEDGTNVSQARAYARSFAITPFADPAENHTFEFDLQIDAMPQYTATALTGSFICYGLNMILADKEYSGLVTGITNTEDGLYFMTRSAGSPSYVALKLNKNVGDKFHVRMDWTTEGALRLYVDGAFVQEFKNAQLNKALMESYSWTQPTMLHLNMWSDTKIPESTADEIDFTMTDLSFGEAPYDTALDALNYDVIKGQNSNDASAATDLELPEQWTNGQLDAAHLQWSSSAPEIISSTGKVTPADTNQAVTLTATLRDYAAVCKNISVMVRSKYMEGVFTTENITVDGILSETSWLYSNYKELATLSGEGAPAGSLAALMKAGDAYLAIPYADAESLYIKLGDKEWTIPLTQATFAHTGVEAAVGAAAVEVRIDLATLGMQLLDYNLDQLKIQATLIKGETTASLDTSPIWLIYVDSKIKDELLSGAMQGTKETISIKNGSGNNAAETGYTITLNGTSGTVYSGAYAGWRQYNYDLIDHNKDIELSADITVHQMPGGTASGTFDGGGSYNGLAIWITDATLNCFMKTVMFHKGDGNLKLVIPRNNEAVASEPVDLGVSVGDVFTLKLAWSSNDTLVVFVNGVEKGSFTDVSISGTYGVGDAVLMRYGDPACSVTTPAKIDISNIAVKVGEETGTIDHTSGNFNLNNTATGEDRAILLSADSNTTAGQAIVIEYPGTSTQGYSGWRQYNVAAIDHSKDIELSANITVHQMSSGEKAGAYNGGGSYYGLTTWIEDKEAASHIKTTIFHTGDGNLKLVIPANTAETSACEPISLGVSVGTSFQLMLRWTAENTLVVIVDGEEKGAFSGAALSKEWVTMDAVAMRFGNTVSNESVSAKISVANLQLKVGDAPVVVGPSDAGFTGTSNYSTYGISVTNLPLASWTISDITAINHGRNMLLEQELNIAAMSGTNNALNVIWEDAQTAHYISTKITADASNSLSLTVGNTPISLGKTVGQKFVLGLRWGTDESLTVYVNGSKVGSVSNASTSGSVFGADALGFRYSADTCTDAKIYLYDAALTVENPTAENALEKVEPLETELSVTAILPGVALGELTESINLPNNASSKYLGTLPLNWTTNDDSLSNAGVVTRPTGRVGRYVDLTVAIKGGKTLWTEEAFVLPLDSGVPAACTVLDAPFTAVVPTIDGSAADEGWNLNIPVVNGDAVAGRFGVQWDLTHLYLAVDCSSEDLTVTLNETSVDLSAVQSGAVKEIALDLDALNITVSDYGAEIEARVEIGSAVWEGTIKLTSKDWFAADGIGERIPNIVIRTSSAGTDQVTDNQKVETTADGYHYYDLYDRNGNNPANIRSSVVLGNSNGKGDGIFTPYGDATAANYAEFDFRADSMPVYSLGEAVGWDYLYACYGFMWYLSRAEDAGGQSEVASMGIFNSAKGLVFVVNGTEPQTYELGKQVGDRFRVGTRMEIDNSVTLFIDGARIANFPNAVKKQMGVGSNILRLLINRSNTPAKSKNDNIDIYITNIAMGKAYGDTLLDSLTFDTIKGTNTNQHGVTANLVLPETLTNPQFTDGPSIAWTSSIPDVINPETGAVTPAESGTLVTLTAVADGKQKDIEVYVKGTSGALNVLTVENDLGTASGSGKADDIYLFTLDTNNNSVIYDLGSKQKVNVVALKDSDAVNRLNESVLTVWSSDDNVTYTMVDSFKILRAGVMTYLYDFETEARYIKVHCTHYDGTEASFTAPLSTMIEAYYEAHFGAEGSFASSKNVTVTNTNSYICYDDAWTVSKSAAGVTGADASIRVYLDKELLYHYVDGNNIIVRIPEIAANGSVELTVLSGNDGAMDISNQEYVYEVVYGIREAYNGDENGAVRWICTLNDGVMFGCTTVDAGEDNSMTNNHVVCAYSYDGGMTWTRYQPIECTKPGQDTNGEGYIVACGGVMYDPSYGQNGRIIIQGISMPKSNADHTVADCKTRFVYSDDLGETWQRSAEMTIVPTTQDTGHYTLSYCDPIILSTNDGDGEGIDYLLPCHTKYNDEGGYCCRVAYTTDAGRTWTLGEDEIIYTGSADTYTKEVGVSEGTILERTDGTLVLYARCQYGDVYRFARSYSSDNGLNWTEEAELGNNYTVNTQPIMHQFGHIPLLTWAGNNALGGNSYARFPLNVAYSTDGLINFQNIQNLYSRYSLQGMTLATGGMATNQTVDFAGDTMTIAWGHDTFTAFMNIKNFTDYFFRTKGAYDSFENTSIKYEGWSVTAGMAAVSTAQKKDGSASMLVAGSSSVVRSIPYLQDGTIMFDLYLDSLDAEFTVELEAAYGTEYGLAAPVAFEFSDGTIKFWDGSSSDIHLNTGWNSIAFNLNLNANQPVATMAVNGGAAVDVPVNTAVDNYVCYVDINNMGVENCYVDRFKVVDAMPVEMPNEDHTLEKVNAKPASCTEDGNVEHWVCAVCGKTFADENAETALKAVVIEATGHDFTNGPCRCGVAGTIELNQATLELENIVYYNVYAETAGFANVSLESSMGLLVWTGDESDYSEELFVIGNENATAYNGAEKKNNLYKVQTPGIAAKELGDEKYMRVYVRVDENTYVYSRVIYSGPQQYVLDRLKNDNSEDLKRTLVAMLDYAAAAQIFFGYRTEDLANDIDQAYLDAYRMEYAETMLQAVVQADSSVVGDLTRDTVNCTSVVATLLLQGNVVNNYRFKFTDSIMGQIDSAKVFFWDSATYQRLLSEGKTFSEADATVVDMTLGEDGFYKGGYDKTAAKNMGDTIYVCAQVTTQDGKIYNSGVIAHSTHAYIVQMYSRNEEKLTDLLQCLTVYGDVAKTYFSNRD